MSERAAFIRAICERPACDTARLVYADWLQENGDDARAAYIRWMIANRYVSPIPRVSFRQWFGLWWRRGCSRSNYRLDSRGRLEFSLSEYSVAGPQNGVRVTRGFVSHVAMPCAVFVEPGFAADLFARQPIESVRLTDRAPYENVAWYDSGPGGNDRNCVPRQILGYWNRLPKSQWRWTQIDRRWMYFESVADAQLTLSDLCVSFGRREAKLPAWEPEATVIA